MNNFNNVTIPFSAIPVVTSQYQFKSKSVLTLRCVSTNSAATNVTWTRNGRPLTLDSSKHTLFQKVTSRQQSTYLNELHICDLPNHLGGSYSCKVSNIFGSSNNNTSITIQGWLWLVCASMIVTLSEKTDHLAPIQFVQYGPKALQRSRSRDFAISMPQCSTAS